MAQQLIKNYMSPDNAVRIAAENELTQLLTSNFQAGYDLLLSAIQLEQFELAEFGTVLVNKMLIEKEYNYNKLTKEQLQKLVQVGQMQMYKEAKLSFLKRMSDMVVKILLKVDDCDYMMTILLDYSGKVSNENQKVTLMYYIEIMCEFAFDDKLLMKNAETLNNIFIQYLGDSNSQIRVAALKAMASFLASIEESSVLAKFQGAVPTLVSKTVEAIQLDQQASVAAVQSLSDLLEQHPKFLKNVLGDLLTLFSQIMDQSSLIIDLRRAGLHGLQTLCHANATFVRKSDFFKQTTLISLMKMLTEVDEQGEWEDQLDENYLQQNDISSTAQDCLFKISNDLTVKYLLPLSIPLIIKCLQSNNWKDQHAGLVAMSMLTEDTAKSFQSELDNIMNMILPMCQSTNKRIVYDLLTCLALLIQEFHTDIQTKFGTQVIDLVVNGMEQTHSAKVQYRSISCLVDFCRELTDDNETAQKVLSPISQKLLEGLYKTIEKNLQNDKPTQTQSKLVQEALTALSALAASMKKAFSNYYDSLMPIMQKIINQVGIIEIKTLAIECMGFLLLSIANEKREQFVKDSETLMTLFIKHQAGLEKDDLQHPSIFCFYTQVAEGLGQQFSVYLPQIFDKVEQAIRIDLGFQVTDFIKEDPSNSKIAKMKVDLKFIGQKTLELNTSALEQKIEGSHTLLALLGACGKSFQPYLERTAEIVKDFISFKNSRDIRETMSKCIYQMMLAADSQQSQIITYLGPFLVEEINKIKVCEDSKILLEQLSDCVRLVRQPLLQDSFLQGCLNSCSKILALCAGEKAEILKEQEEADAEGKEELDEELEDIDEIQDHITDITSHLIKVYGQRVEAMVVNNLMPEFFKSLSANKNQKMLISSIAFFNTVLPHCSNEIFSKGYDQISQIYIQLANSKDLTVKQNVIFGLGNFAMKAQANQFGNALNVAIQLSNSIMSEPDAKNLNKINSYETAVGTMGKLGLFQNQSQLVNTFLNNLPLQHEDAQEVHMMLLEEVIDQDNQYSDQVEKQNPVLVQVKDQLMAKLQEIKMQDNNNPENEILSDEARLIINRVLSM